MSLPAPIGDDSAIFAEPLPRPSSTEPGVSSRRTSFARARLGRWRKLFGHEWIVTVGLLGLDLALWVTIYLTATLVRDDSFFVTPLQFGLVAFLQLICIIGAMAVIGAYNRHTEIRGLPYATEHVLALLGAAMFSALLVYAAAAFDETMKPSRAAFTICFAAFLVLSLAYRRLVWRFIAASTAHRAFLVVGGGPMAAEFYRNYKSSVNRQRLEFVAIDPKRIGHRLAGPGSPIIEGDLETKLDRLDQSYSGVVVAERIDRLQPELLDRLVRTQFQRVRVYTIESFHEAHWRHVPIEALDPFWPLQMGFQLARTSPFHYLKKGCDLVFASLLLVIVSPILLFVMLAIWLETGSPTIFRQTRVGRNNELFTAYKFRTMRARGTRKSERGTRNSETRNADTRKSESGARNAADVGNAEAKRQPAESPLAAQPERLCYEGAIEGNGQECAEEDDIYTRRDDPRVTRVGRWLRKLRLDELPQVVNVFRGEMSLIGPRAEWIECATRYEKVIPFYHFRHLVKPGITGWAQVNYPYGESDADAIEKLKYDLYYIRNYSLKLDLMIVLKTVYTVLFGKGQ